MRLTAKDDPETIKRYGHIKPARGWRTRRCSSRCPGTAHTCTLEHGHRGPHVAHGAFKKVVAVWDAGAGLTPSSGSLRRQLDASADRALRTDAGSRRPILVRMVSRILSSPEELIFGVMFLAFVYFAIEWMLLIFG